VRLLEALASTDRDRIWGAHSGRALRVKRRQVVFHEGDPSDGVYLLIEGEVRTFAGTDDAERTTSLLRAPALFGDRDAIAGVDAQDGASALLPSRLLVFDRADLDALVAADAAFVLRDLAERGARAAALASLAMLPIADRVLRIASDAAAIPDLDYLADIAGATPKSISRAVAELRKTGHLLEGEPLRCARPAEVADSVFHSIRGAPRSID
jgi:CRP-like cAMP-binding protein